MNTMRILQSGSSDDLPSELEVVCQENASRKPDVSKVSQQVLKEAAHSIDVAINVPLDKEYFSNPENVRRDLEAFMQAYNASARPGAQLGSIAEMNTCKPSNNTAANLVAGFSLTWHIYLHRCIVALTGEKTYDSALQKMPRSEVIQYFQMCLGSIAMSDYFSEDTTPAQVLKDLEKFLVVYNTDIPEEMQIPHVSLMTTKRPSSSTTIQLPNGKRIKWGGYLYHWARSLMIDKVRVTQTDRYSALKYLFSRCEITTTWHEKYFDDKDRILRDLDNFRNIHNSRASSDKQIDTLADFTVSSPLWNTEISLANGVVVSWKSYIRNYIRLSRKQTIRVAEQEVSALEAIEEIKSICDIDTTVFSCLSSDYFASHANVLRDLEEFRLSYNALGLTQVLTTIVELQINEPSRRMRIYLLDGRSISFPTYLLQYIRAVTAKPKEYALKELPLSQGLQKLKLFALSATECSWIDDL